MPLNFHISLPLSHDATCLCIHNYAVLYLEVSSMQCVFYGRLCFQRRFTCYASLAFAVSFGGKRAEARTIFSIFAGSYMFNYLKTWRILWTRRLCRFSEYFVSRSFTVVN